MKQATILSVCECESQLEAVLDEQRHVLAGFVTGANDGIRERSPAHSIEVGKNRFDVAWLCPVCGRNTLRSFDAGRLAFREGEAPAPAAGPAPQLLGVPGPGPATPGLRLGSPAAATPPSSRAGAAPASAQSPASAPAARPSSSPPSGASGTLTGSSVATAVALKSMSTHKTPVPPAKPASAAPAPFTPVRSGGTLPGIPPAGGTLPSVPPARPSTAPATAAPASARPAVPAPPASSPRVPEATPAPTPPTDPDKS